MKTLNSNNATQLITKYAGYESLYRVKGTLDEQQSALLSILDSLQREDMQLVLDETHIYSVPELKVTFSAPEANNLVLVTGEFPDQGVFASLRLDVAAFASQFYQFVRNMLIRLEQYYYRLYNAEQLTEYVRDILKESDITEQIDFTCGEGISNLTNNHITIGLATNILDHLGTLFTQDMKQSVLETYSSLPCIIECVRRKTLFNTKLGCYYRSSARTIIRKAYHQDARLLHSGIGYFENNQEFSLIDIRACTNTELDELRKQYGNLLQVRQNTEPRSKDMWVAKNEAQLEQLKTRCHKKGYSYRIEMREGNKTYNVIYKQYIACAVCFGPVNLDTYETRYTETAKDLFNF